VLKFFLNGAVDSFVIKDQGMVEQLQHFNTFMFYTVVQWSASSFDDNIIHGENRRC